MTVRLCAEHDTPQIIGLLKSSLGESLLPKSEAFWRWKHVENPFGASPVLVAEEDGQLIGVRAFMRWRWQRGAQIFSALRAVDTATHPDHQGKGIFKKLTLDLLETCKTEGDHFIFNTPNQSSKPGYLKMGWSEVGKIPIRVKIARPFRLARHKFFGKNDAATLTESLSKFNIHAVFQDLASLSWVDKIAGSPGHLFTPKSAAFLKWRYADCPVLNYSATAGEDFLIIFYIKNHRIGRELRIVELLQHPEKPAGMNLSKTLSALQRATKPDFISVAPPANVSIAKMLNRNWVLPPCAIGPALTFRALNVEKAVFSDTSNWQYSLGDFELF